MTKAGKLASRSRNIIIAASVALVFGVSGYLLTTTHASGFFAANEAESGTLSGNATSVSDNTASGGKAIQFNAPAAPPTGGGGGTGGGTTGSSSCPLPKFPTPSCTGVPAGTSLTTHSGDYTVTTAGTVISGMHVTGGIEIRATNVVIKNSQIDGDVTNDGISNSSFSITDSTLGTNSCSSVGTPSLYGHDITATRVYMRGHQDGLDVGGDNVTVTDSYIFPCYLPIGSDGFHSDGVQDICGATCSNLTLTHNTIDARAIYNGKSTGNSALNLGSVNDGSHLRSVTLKDNLFMGGGFSTVLRYTAGNKWVVSGNAWVSGSYTYDAISGEGTCANQTWSGNTIVNMDANYNITSTVKQQPCIN